MTAELLREAAALMRERAEAATPGPWHPATTGVECGDHWSVIEYPAMNPVARVPSDDGSNDDQREPDARHIASWHPAVALAVADVLDSLAQRAEDICDATPTVEFGNRVAEQNLTGYAEAATVARAYLNRSDA
jgi:hypothetical protein